IIEADTLTRDHFTLLNQFKKFPLNYNLLDNTCYESTNNQFPQPLTHYESGSTPEYSAPWVSTRQYIEFNVIWLGHPSYVLSVDSIIVSDLRGEELLDPNSVAENRLHAQADAFDNLAYTDSVVG